MDNGEVQKPPSEAVKSPSQSPARRFFFRTQTVDHGSSPSTHKKRVMRGMAVGLATATTITAASPVVQAFHDHIPSAPIVESAGQFAQRLNATPAPENPEVLKGIMENAYGFVFNKPEETLPYEIKGEKIETIPWSAAQLGYLQERIKELPRSLYAPRIGPDGLPMLLKIALYKSPAHAPTKDSACACGLPHTPSQVIFDAGMLDSYKNQAITVDPILHELIHHVTQSEIDRFGDLILEPLDLNSDERIHTTFADELSVVPTPDILPDGKPALAFSATPEIFSRQLTREPNLAFITPHFAVDQRLLDSYGQQHFEDQAKLYEQRRVLEKETSAVTTDVHQEQATSLIQIVKEGTKKEIVAKHGSHLGHGALNRHEMLAVSGEYYRFGKKTFHTAYDPFLGKERAERLYEGLKQHIFAGKEY